MSDKNCFVFLLQVVDVTHLQIKLHPAIQLMCV